MYRLFTYKPLAYSLSHFVYCSLSVCYQEDSLDLTYSDYLKLDTLLELQVPRSTGPEHDEMLFIVTHQVYELWFKQMIHECCFLRTLFAKENDVRIWHTFKRCLKIMKTMVSQIDILETMTPTEFISFRSYLESSSGFQSVQFREFEYILGNKNEKHLKNFSPDSKSYQKLKTRLEEPSLWECFLRYLKNKGYDVPEQALLTSAFAADYPADKVQRILLEVYKTDHTSAEVCEVMVDLDEGQQEWRYRHVKMVERTIGNKRGTGGSLGVRYLNSTLSKPVFPDLWAIRTEL